MYFQKMVTLPDGSIKCPGMFTHFTNAYFFTSIVTTAIGYGAQEHIYSLSPRLSRPWPLQLCLMYFCIKCIVNICTKVHRYWKGANIFNFLCAHCYSLYKLLHWENNLGSGYSHVRVSNLIPWVSAMKDVWFPMEYHIKSFENGFRKTCFLHVW